MSLFANVGEVQKTNYTQNTKPNKDISQLDETTQLEKQQKEIEKEKTKTTKEELQHLTEQLNKEMSPLNPDIKFQFNDKVEELVVNVIDKNTDKIIRKIPSDEALKIMEKMRELVGALFDKKG
jgi:flagellar protein FlaG